MASSSTIHGSTDYQSAAANNKTRIQKLKLTRL